MPIIASILLATIAPAVTVDKAAHSVTFTARATDVDIGTIIEFAFVGPESDRAYEAMFVTDASVTEILNAFDEAAIPRGKPICHEASRFWPAGNVVTVTPDISNFISDSVGAFKLPIVYTGGQRDLADNPVANTNMPSAIFATYGLPQSPLQFDSPIDQSAVYGRFTCRKKLVAGERYAFKVAWNGKNHVQFQDLVLAPDKIHEAIKNLKGAACPLDVKTNFSDELTIAEAKAAAAAISVIESADVRFNGFSEGQMFYQAFLPDEKWRDRQKRLTQPLEVRIDATNTVFTLIDEDWNVEGLDPKLTASVVTIQELHKKYRGDACIFFSSADMKVGKLYAIMKTLPRNIRYWYVFTD